MKFSDLTLLESLPYFTIEAVKQLGEDKDTAPDTIRTALYRWMKTGRVIQIKKGIYTTRRFYEDENFSMAISAIIMPQSYVSLEFILQRNAILTDITYPISAINPVAFLRLSPEQAHGVLRLRKNVSHLKSIEPCGATSPHRSKLRGILQANKPSGRKTANRWNFFLYHPVCHASSKKQNRYDKEI